MTTEMFCFQCEQTAFGSGCTGKAGVCGKKSPVAKLQDRLTGAMIGLARAAQGEKPDSDAHRALIAGLFTTITNVSIYFIAKYIRWFDDSRGQISDNCHFLFSLCFFRHFFCCLSKLFF